jgi:predicted ArsR family transcriptional regulator
MPTFIDSQCDLPLFASARRNDPPTSKVAARMAGGVIADHQRRILDALVVGPGSKDEIAERAGLSEQRVARRMAGLRRAGLVEATGIKRLSASGRPETVWKRKEANYGR